MHNKSFHNEFWHLHVIENEDEYVKNLQRKITASPELKGIITYFV